MNISLINNKNYTKTEYKTIEDTLKNEYDEERLNDFENNVKQSGDEFVSIFTKANTSFVPLPEVEAFNNMLNRMKISEAYV